MVRLSALFAGVVTLMLIASSGLYGVDDKKDPPTKVKGTLPANWAKLGLTDEQKQKVYRAQSEYREKIGVLEQQIKELKEKERSEMEKVLTDAQKARLKELANAKVPDSDKKTDDKKTEDKKTDDKK
jgi:Spy/CpxP family protein refolding chaperone